MPRARVSWQLIIGWIPLWALYATLLYVMHPPISARSAAVLSLIAIVPAALLGLVVHRVARRFPWPRPFRLSFLLLHLVLSLTYGLAWILGTSAVESIMRHRLVLALGAGFAPFLVLGVLFYAMIAGVSYSHEERERAAAAEAAAARAQLAALRSQLHPHFLFNALHTVVQLIPREPARAAEAAEQIAQLLRTVVEEDRDVVRVSEEWDFVRQYLEIERIRFGDRLAIREEIAGAARDAALPSFALQTLVENAVRHGAAPRVETTHVLVSADVRGDRLTIRVADDGAGAEAAKLGGGAGTGLARLRERLAALYGTAATLAVESAPGRGFTATLTLPLSAAAERDEVH